MRFFLAIRVFFATLFRAELAPQIERLLEGGGDEKAQPQPEEKPAAPPPRSRSEALTLLAAMQREARFVDLVNEPLGDYSDAQIGAAARDVLRECSAVLARMFQLQPLLGEKEGSDVEVVHGFDPGRYRLTGNVGGQPPYRGRLVHHGWEATKCELPSWSGNEATTFVVAAAEVELTK